MKNFYIGIDGGGTKTRAIVTDEKFKLIGTGFGGPANLRLSVSESWNSIYSAVNAALKDVGLSLENKDCVFHAGMGLAGVSILKAKKEFLETPNPFKTLILESDAHIGCLAAHDGRDGAIISIGTGIIAYLIENGESSRAGGWGFPHADLGGGAWIGLEAVKLAFKAAEGAVESSEMTEALFAKFNRSLIDFCAWACAAKSSDFASLAPCVIDYLKREDFYALALIKSAAAEIDDLYTALFKKSKASERKLKCAILGGLGKILYPYLKDKKNIFLPDESKSAELGAIYMLQQKLSMNFQKITK